MSERSPRHRPVNPRTGRLYRVVRMMTPLSQPPPPLKQAKLDNLALLPASELPLIKHWQRIANELPAGTTLIILPRKDSPVKQALKTVANRMQAKGRKVSTLPSELIDAAIG